MTINDKGVKFSNLSAFKTEVDKVYIANDKVLNLTSSQKVQAQNNLIGKEYDPTNFSGLGRKVLDKNIQTVSGVLKNILTQAHFQDNNGNPLTNTTFVIQHDYDLNGLTINVPTDCIVLFEGGHIYNGLLNNKFNNDVYNITDFMRPGTTDITDALNMFIEMQKTAVRKQTSDGQYYKKTCVIYIPSGIWECGEIVISDIITGIIIKGETHYVAPNSTSSGTIIQPRDSNQTFIWLLGYADSWTYNIAIENITFSDFNSTRCNLTNGALRLLGMLCCWFKGLQFRDMKGCAIRISSSWELDFDSINLRHIEGIGSPKIYFDNTISLDWLGYPNISLIHIGNIYFEAIDGVVLFSQVGSSLDNVTIDSILGENSSYSGGNSSDLSDEEYASAISVPLIDIQCAYRFNIGCINNAPPRLECPLVDGVRYKYDIIVQVKKSRAHVQIGSITTSIPQTTNTRKIDVIHAEENCYLLIGNIFLNNSDDRDVRFEDLFRLYCNNVRALSIDSIIANTSAGIINFTPLLDKYNAYKYANSRKAVGGVIVYNEAIPGLHIGLKPVIEAATLFGTWVNPFSVYAIDLVAKTGGNFKQYVIRYYDNSTYHDEFRNSDGGYLYKTIEGQDYYFDRVIIDSNDASGSFSVTLIEGAEFIVALHEVHTTVSNRTINRGLTYSNGRLIYKSAPNTYSSIAFLPRNEGTTALRPTPGSTQIGAQYFDTTLGKPIYWTNDTSNGKSGWVDATGADMPNS